jgi:hypothetical protein
MIAAPKPGAEYRDKHGTRATVGAVNEVANQITFAVWGRTGPCIETMTITEFFRRFVLPNLPADCEV